MALRSFADDALFAEVLGEGAPRVLALHGWGRRGADFKPGLEGLPAIAPDLPGFGASPPPKEVIGAVGYADIIAGMLPDFDTPPILIGHSFGGRIALCLADRHPDRVGPLILTGAPLLRLASPARPSFGYRSIRLLNKIGVVSDERLELERRKRGSSDYRAVSGIMRDILVKVVNETYEHQLTSVTSDIALLWGENDEEVPVEVARRALIMREKAGLPVTLTVVEAVGHGLPLKAPESLRKLVDEALG